MTHQFLSEEWMEAAHGIREKYADQVPPVTLTLSPLNAVEPTVMAEPSYSL